MAAPGTFSDSSRAPVSPLVLVSREWVSLSTVKAVCSSFQLARDQWSCGQVKMPACIIFISPFLNLMATKWCFSALLSNLSRPTVTASSKACRLHRALFLDTISLLCPLPHLGPEAQRVLFLFRHCHRSQPNPSG